MTTPNVPTTHSPTSISAIAPTIPPAWMNVSTSGGSSAVETSSVRRIPNLSAIGPRSERAEHTRDEHQREEPVALGLGAAERDDPERHERDQRRTR